MNLALDYDETFTVDPDLWKDFVKNAIDRGHKVYLITMRHGIPEGIYATTLMNEYSEVFEATKGMSFSQIIFTGRKAKKLFCDDIGLSINVWIDDNPLWLYNDG